MSEYVPVAVLVVTIIGLYNERRHQQQVIRQQAEEIKQQAEQLEELRKGERRKRIERYYPPLAEDLRHSLPNIAYLFKEGSLLQYKTYFNVLIEMANNSTLNIIEALDEELHNHLMSILLDFIPAEKELDKKKDESWKQIPRKWQKWIVENYNDIPMWSTTPEEFVNELTNSLLWPIWRDQENLVHQNFDRAFERYIMTKGDERKTIHEKELIYREFLRIVEEEWKPIRDKYKRLHKELDDLVVVLILPRMSATLKSLGE